MERVSGEETEQNMSQRMRTGSAGKLINLCRNCLVFFCIFAAAVAVCFFYRTAAGLEAYASPIFVLAVLLVSRFTEGYIYGLAAAVIGVICVNYFFTYPYMAVNFSISGYPLTFFTLLVVSLITSTLTTRAKQRDLLEIENEREKIRSDLLRSVSHDIRTPLTSIIGSTAAILESDDMSREKENELLKDVQEEATWLLRMTENLLIISKMDMAQPLTMEEWAVEEVIGETAQRIQKNYPQVYVEVSVPDAPLFIPMDPILIRQALFNLAENGILHGKTTTLIRIAARRTRDAAIIEIRDNGAGFPPEFLSSFEADRLQTEISPDGSGRRNLGLGLQVSKAILKAHNGQLILHNDPQGGAAAGIVLPLRPDRRKEYQQ